MIAYNTILLDADDTLLDFAKSEALALEKSLGNHNLPYSPRTDALYQSINRELWAAFEQQLVTKEALMETRFALLFKAMGIYDQDDLESVAFNREYLENLGDGTFLMEHAEEACRQLTALGCKLYIVTNGVSRTQHRRINRSAIEPYLSGLFVSEDSGSQKPMKEYFDYVFQRIPNFNPSQTLMVGDSLSSDIKGGANAGLSTCWYNPTHKPNLNGPIPTYEIEDLLELPFIILAE